MEILQHIWTFPCHCVDVCLQTLLLAVSYCACPSQPDMRSSQCLVSAWHRPAGPQNKMFGRDLRQSHSQSVVVTQVNVVWHSARICWLNILCFVPAICQDMARTWLNGLEWYGLVLASDQLSKSDNFTSRETWQLSNESRWISANIDALPCIVNCRLLLERSAWTLNNITCVVHCLLNASFWTTINRFVKL